MSISFTSFILFVFLSTGQLALAQTATVRSLYQNSTLIPGSLLPFEIKGSLINEGAQIVGTKVTQSNSADCRTMTDPFNRNVVLLKCTSETDLSMQFNLLSGSTVYEINYGPVQIRNPSGGLTIIQPVIEDPKIRLGASLFNAHCVSCHTATDKKGRTAGQISSAILTNGQMKAIPGLAQLSTSDKDKIAAYLKSVK